MGKTGMFRLRFYNSSMLEFFRTNRFCRSLPGFLLSFHVSRMDGVGYFMIALQKEQPQVFNLFQLRLLCVEANAHFHINIANAHIIVKHEL